MSKKILIVDDDESIRTGFQEVFQGEGFDALSAAHAREACEIAKKFKPDCVILDYYLINDQSGVDICKFIKESKELKHTKMIMITGVLTKNQAKKMIHFGFDKIIIKPVESKHLIEETRQLLEA